MIRLLETEIVLKDATGNLYRVIGTKHFSACLKKRVKKYDTEVLKSIDDAVQILSINGDLGCNFDNHLITHPSKKTRRLCQNILGCDNIWDFHPIRGRDLVVLYVISRKKREVCFCTIGTHKETLGCAYNRSVPLNAISLFEDI